jgi:hypothetical protein
VRGDSGGLKFAKPERLAAGDGARGTVVPLLETVKWIERRGWLGQLAS